MVEYHNKRIVHKAMMTLLLIMAYAFSIRAQSLHAAIWYFNGFQIDFTTTPTSFSYADIDNEFLNGITWYIDESGQHVLTVANKILYDKDMNPIPTNYGWHGGFFVPIPGNEKLVYYYCCPTKIT